jgi:hypothetical protein
MRRFVIAAPDGVDDAEATARLAALDARQAGAKALLEAPGVRERARDALREVDLYVGLKSTVRRSAQAVTNAWLKLYEILGDTLVLEEVQRDGVARVFCNAELPGGFIAALHHYGERVGVEVDWRAASLRPDRPGALGDQYGLMKHNAERWLMDDTCAGDLTDPTDVAELVRRAGGPVYDLYTSDAGVDIGTDFDRQEELNAAVHAGQVSVGLRLLRAGGAMLVKTYSFALPASVGIAAQMSGCFDSVELLKPQTSRPANSEVYLLGRGFRPERADRLDVPFGATARSLADATEQLTMDQEEAIDTAVLIARDPRALQLKAQARRAAGEWLEDHPVDRLRCPLAMNKK